MNNLASALTGVAGERVALTDVAVSAVLQDLLAVVTVTQTYRNDEAVNIEAVYTFPLPLDAVLLDLQVEIGGRVLKGLVVGKQAAEERYEDAVAAGDAAVMLEVSEQGLYTMNVGNLLPGETARIAIKYALLYRWTGDSLRLDLPTTIAPRYGESPLRPHQVPETSLTVENRFSLQVAVHGALCDARFHCPSHRVALARSAESIVISLQQERAVMDRDFVLNITAPNAARSFALCGADHGGMAAVASFQPFFPGLQQPRPLQLAIVVDCSGSMAGDSIEQARQALAGILDALEPSDRVTLIAFGNTTSLLSDRLLPCNETNLEKARRFAKNLKADMGGTEIGQALRDANAAIGGAEAGDIFLVTDGEVASWEAVVREAKGFGYRIFTVGVGSAVSEAFVRGLAEQTGGACELVSPREGMANRVIRHFERMRAPRAGRVAIRWPEGATGIAPSTWGAVFEGDTVIASARFDRAQAGASVVLEIETEGAGVTRHALALPALQSTALEEGASTVARLAAAARLKELTGSAATDTAVRYQLASAWTNWIVVAERLEGQQAEGMPALRKVPNTMAAGWGGAGGVGAVMGLVAAPSPAASPLRASNRMDFLHVDAPSLSSKSFASAESVRDIDFDAMGALPMFERWDVTAPVPLLITLIEAEPARLSVGQAHDLLREAGLAPEFDHLFRQAAANGFNVDVLAALVVSRLLGPKLCARLSPEARQAADALRVYSKRIVEVLRELSRQSSDMVATIAIAVDVELLAPAPGLEFKELLMRYQTCRDLLDAIRSQARKVANRLAAEPALAA